MLKPATKDVPKIKEKLEAVNKIVQEASTELYQKAQQSQSAASEPGSSTSSGDGKDSSGEEASRKDEKVVDAEYEVKDDGKRKPKK